MTKRLECDQCNGIVDLILKDHDAGSPQQASGETMQEFQELMEEDSSCQERFICLPLMRLRSSLSPVESS